MICPVDGSTLLSERAHGVDAEVCPDCAGMWLDVQELDELEDRQFDKDLDKGSLIFESHESDYSCPECGAQMRRFKYRLHDLSLDFCPNLHGYWLDGSEDRRVLELMQERYEDINRKILAEKKWAKLSRRYRSPTFLDRLKNFMTGT